MTKTICDLCNDEVKKIEYSKLHYHEVEGKKIKIIWDITINNKNADLCEKCIIKILQKVYK